MKNSILILCLISFVISCSQPKSHSNKNNVFMGNNTHTANFTSASVTKNPKTLWKVKTGGQVIGSPVIVDNTLFIGSEDKNLYAINATTGEVIWKFKTNGAVNSTPVLTNNKVMFLSYDGFFYCLNQKNGNLIWEFETEGESKFLVKDYFDKEFKPDFWDFYLSSAAIKGDTVFFGSSDANIYALNTKNGDKLWQFKTKGGVHSSPAIYNNTLVVGSWDSNIYALNTNTGEEIWKFTAGNDTKDYIYIGIQASPSIDKKGTVYIGSRNAKYYALSIENGEVLWTNNEFEGSWMPSSSAIGETNIFTGSSDAFNFYSIDKKTGQIIYTTKTNAYTFSSPAIDSSMAYIGSANGRLFGIDLSDGKVNWQYKTEGLKTDTLQLFDDHGILIIDKYMAQVRGITDMPSLSKFTKKFFSNTGAILSSPIVNNQVVYFGSCDGYIYAITDK